MNLKYSVFAVVMGVAIVTPVSAWADTFCKMIEFNCEEESNYFSARTFSSYNFCGAETSERFMSLRYWSENPISCKLKSPKSSSLADSTIELKVSDFYPARNGMCAGTDTGKAELNIDGQLALSFNGTHKLDGTCSQMVDHIIEVEGHTAKHCQIVYNKYSDEFKIGAELEERKASCRSFTPTNLPKKKRN